MTDNPFSQPTPADDPTAPPPATESRQVDTSSPTFESAFDNLAAVAQEAQRVQETIPHDSMSELEVHGESPNGKIMLSMKDAHVTGLRISQFWLEDASAEDLERELTAVINDTIDRYNAALLEGIKNVTPELSEVSQAIDAVRSQFRQAFDEKMAWVERGGQ